MCRGPVGLGANRTRIFEWLIVSKFFSLQRYILKKGKMKGPGKSFHIKDPGWLWKNSRRYRQERLPDVSVSGRRRACLRRFVSGA